MFSIAINVQTQPDLTVKMSETYIDLHIVEISNH